MQGTRIKLSKVNSRQDALATYSRITDALTIGQIQELKAFAKPPKDVAGIFEVVSKLLGKPQSWADAKKMMANA